MRSRNHSDFDRLWMAAGKKIKEREYWLGKLSGELVKSSFPTTYEDNAAGDGEGSEGLDIDVNVVNFTFSKELSPGLLKLSTGSDVRLHIVLTAVLTLLLGKYSGNTDIIVGTPVLKTGSDVELLNTVLAIRNQLPPDMTFKELLLQVRQTMIEADEHGDYPIELVVHQLNLPVYSDEEGGDFPLFDVAIMMENIHDKQYLSHVNPGIIFSFLRTHESIRGHVEYRALCYHPRTIERIVGHFQHLVEKVLSDVEIRVSDIEWLLPEEKQKILFDFNDTGEEYPRDKTLREMFAEQVERTPDHMALVGKVNSNIEIRNSKVPGGGTLLEGTGGLAPLSIPISITYRELNEKSDQLAFLLQEKGVQPDTIVAIMVERSLEMIIGLLAILKIGSAYLPIDPDYPEDRINYMLEDSRAGILLKKFEIRNPKSETNPNDPNSNDQNKRTAVTVLDFGHLNFGFVSNFDIRISDLNASNLAYVIYTSGSTGRPKGVMVEHRNILRLVKNCNYIDFETTDRLLPTGAFAFDITTFEIWWPLLNGLTIYMVPDDIILDAGRFGYVMVNYHITILHLTPQLFNQLAARDHGIFAHLRALLVGGDLVRPRYVNLLRNRYKHLKILHMYGPTENTTFSTFFPVEKEYDTFIPIGKPISNTTVYILDRHHQLQPIGVMGELCIGGAGVSRGYLNNPELTFERFVNYKLQITMPLSEKKAGAVSILNPKSQIPNKHRSYMSHKSYIYKTGDLARWLPDGNIEFLGRIDHQVKIRGFRIESGEIENQLLMHGEIKEAVVTLRENIEGEKYLCAYVVSTGAGVSSSMLREFLSRTLPGYMVPAYFVMLEKMPLNPSGKMDVKALPEPGLEGRGVVYTAPRDEVETKLAEIWQEVLDLPAAPGIDDNFLDLGGHSLKATILTTRVHQVFQVELPLSHVLKRTTIRELSGSIRQAQKSKYTGIELVEEREYYPLSSAQKRLYFLQQMDLKSTAYNMPSALPLKKDIEIDKLGAILRKLIPRHESLRTSFKRMNETPVQKIHPPGEIQFEIEYYELSGPPSQKESYSQLAGNIIKNFARPFDLSRAPLIRSGIIQLPDNQYIWLVDLHHIVSDGTSHTILTEDFMALYDGKGLEPLRLRYRDFSQWQNRLFETGVVKNQEDYWLELYSDAEEIPRLNLPTDYKRPEVFTFVGDHVEFLMEREEALAFKALCSRIGATLYMNILAVLNTLFYRYTGQTDIIIGTGIAGRPHADLQHMMGMFVNTLVMRNYPGGEKTYESFLKEVMAHSVKAFENQDVQFEELVDRLDVERNPSRNPLFDVCLVVENFRQVRETMNLPLVDEDLSIEYKHPTSKFDMTFFVLEPGDDVVITIEYYTDVYKEETIKRLTSHFRNIIKAVIGDPSIKLKDIDIIFQEEKQQMLYQWNDTAREYPFDKTAQELFEAQVEQTPDRIAVWTGYTPQSPENQRFITYSELNKRANQLANYLYQEKRIRPDDLVGILMDKSIHLVIAILGILKAGGAYVPIEPSTPEERIKTIINDARIEVVISRKKCIRVLNRLQWECDSFHTFLCMDSMEIHREEEAEKNELMDEKLWDYVGEQAFDDVTGGGWINSYTGEPFGREEMDEYGDNVLKKLKPLLDNDMRVLEIGCASGITMYRLAPLVGFYCGTDLSRVIIEKNKEKVRQEGHGNIKLACLPAHEICRLNEKDFHLIILNSVIQSFHGHNYLRRVISQCIDLLGERGHIFIGDVMDHDLKDALVHEMKTFKQSNSAYGSKTKVDWSSELFVSQGFFKDLTVDFPRICQVEFSDKIYTIENELTKFRYDALLRIDKRERLGDEGKVRSKGKYQEDLTALQRFGTEGLVDGARSHSSDLAYVIYTSGTTGTPRGVMIRHQSLVNYVYWGIRQYIDRDKAGGVEEIYYFPLYTSISFDLTVTSIFLPLISGNTIVVYDHEQPQLAIFAVFDKGSGAVDIVKATPSHLKLLLSEQDHKSSRLNRVKRFIVGGEAFETLLARDICRSFAGEVEIYNEYGPTEATVGCMIYRFGDSHDQRETVPIGVPVDNTMIFLLDRNLNPVPLNAVGELYIGGEGIARGYLNRPKLTAEKFIDYPITPLHHSPIYRTGDLARWLPNGNMEFLGRIDDQVKIRGYRIEIKEIEAQLLKHSDITEAVVISRDDGAGNGETYLCAYITSPLKEIDPVGLKEYLSREVPDYMIPSYVVQLERIPLTPNGKVDRKALPKTGAKRIDENYPAPRNPVEKKLVETWSEVLHVEKGEIGIDSNFFDLGGHSLRATVLIAKIHKKLGIQVPLAEVFNRQTIRGLSGYIEHAPQCKYGGIVPVEKKEYYALSSAQKRLYFLQQMDLNSTAYNMPLFLPLRDLQEDRLELALKTLIARHESLRTSFKMINDVPVQEIHDQVKFSSNYYEIPGVEEVGDISTIAAQIEKIKEDFVYPFDLSQVPLLRSGIVKLPDNHHVWMVDIHHIVFDGTSHMIITEELMALLNGEELEPLRLQYKDFSQWQNRLIGSGWMKAQEDYWLDLYWDAKEIPPLNLPVDDKRPETFTFVGTIYSFMLEGENAVKFRALGSRNGATLYMNILVLLNTLFYKYTGQTDIVIGSGIAGRPHDDLQLIIGMFVNTLAMRNHPEGEKTYESFLKEIVDHSIKAFENQDVQFEELVDKLELERNPSRNPLFDVTMVVQNFRRASEGGKIGKREKGKGVIELPGVDENLPYVRYENTTSKFDLTFFIHEDKEDIHVNIEYYTAIFKQETIQCLVTHFKNIIKTVIKDPFIKLKDIDILSEEEKRQVLFEFNNTARVYPGDKTIPGLFEEQVEKAPDHIALAAPVGQIPILKEISITYRELDKKANQLANYLYFEKNIQPEEAVGVLMERSILLLVSLLGILKAGGAYVPLDPDYPEERLKDIINDAGVNIVISRKNQVKTLNRLQWESPGFHTFLCLDSTDVYSEEEVEKSGLMDEKLWEYIGESAADDITGGGWLTGTTGQPFTRQEMDEYGDNILKKLKPLLDKSMRVLEMGCASGISMYRIAPLVGLYYGTDLSQVIIEKNKEKVRQEGYGNIKLACLPAHEILQIKSEEKNFDLVIINSVIQSFHGHNYLRWVICQVLDLMADQGFLFIGDVMDQDLKGEFIGYMKEFKRANAGKSYTSKTDWSEELFISRSFFEDLTLEFPGIHDVEFSDKIYTIENELTLFRYDALLRVDKKAAKDSSRPKHKYQEDARVLQKYGTQKPLMFVTSHQLAYVIYTSGSSGKPKGVMIEHGNVGRLIKNTNFIQWGEGAHLLPTGSIAFDISTFEIWGPLLNGAGLVLVDKSVLLDGSLFEPMVHRHRVTHLHLIPQLFDQLASGRPGLFGGLGYFLVGGDLVRPKYVNEIRKRYKDLTILHMYGPTENTTFSTFFPVDDEYEEILPIGRPISTSTVYILDRYQRLQPIGVCGELCVGGSGVARGYLNNPELTAEKFFPRFNRSYKSYRSYISKKVYKTGDLARWLKDSNIEFLGRVDSQVKVRGFRIELGEIESQLLTHDLIKDVVVIDREEEGEKYLCAYIVSGESLDVSGLKDFLSGRLPDYMVPSYVMPIDKIPVTPNGKVDRRSLPEPGYEGLGDEYIAPRDYAEEKLVEIWSEVLQVDREKISIDTSFFDLGGHSLKATQLVSKIHKELNINLPLAEVFKTPNISALAAFIKEKAGSEQDRYSSIEPSEKKDRYALSSAQKRLYLIQQMDETSTGYNSPVIFTLEGVVDKKRFEKAFGKLVQRHESFRTSFHMIDEAPVQRIHEKVELEIENYQIHEKNEKIEEIFNDFIKPFDLSKAPLLRVRLEELLSGDAAAYILMVDMHHIISDGLSNRILVEEFELFYNGQDLPPLRLQYKDFSGWQNQRLNTGELKKQEEFWQEEFKGEIPVLQLPMDFPRPSLRSFQGSCQEFEIPVDQLEKLWELAASDAVTIFTLLFTLYNVFLAKLSGQEDIIVGTVAAGRRHADLEPIIGMFVNTLALRNYPKGDFTFKEFLKDVSRRTVNGFDHQDYQFENLVGKVLAHRDITRNPLFDVVFNHFVGEPNKSEPSSSDSPGDWFELKVSPYNRESTQTKFDLVLSVQETGKQLAFGFYYSTCLFKKETIKRFVNYFKEILSSVIENPDVKLEDITISYDLSLAAADEYKIAEGDFEF